MDQLVRIFTKSIPLKSASGVLFLAWGIAIFGFLLNPCLGPYCSEIIRGFSQYFVEYTFQLLYIWLSLESARIFFHKLKTEKRSSYNERFLALTFTCITFLNLSIVGLSIFSLILKIEKIIFNMHS